MVVKAHDLLEILEPSYLQWNLEKEWVISSLERTPFVVVRRAQQINSVYIPVGIRGIERNQREAAFIHPNGIKKVITPYWLVEQRMWEKANAKRQKNPVLSSLKHVEVIMSNWTWGVTGSAGFEIATGVPTLRETSDLDLVIDAPKKIDFFEATNLLQQLDTLNIRIDIQIETENGAFLLREWVNQKAQTVLVRTKSGPLLVSDPWDIQTHTPINS